MLLLGALKPAAGYHARQIELSMDTLTFIAAMTESLAWPRAVCVMAFALRDKLGETLLKIRRIRHHDTEIDFAREVWEMPVTVAAPDAAGVAAGASGPPNELDELFPRGSILESWMEVESALENFNRAHNIVGTKSLSAPGQREILQILDYDVLDPGTVSLLYKLRSLRNRAVHLTDADIDPAVAMHYRAAANQVVGAIEQVRIKQ